MVFRKTGDVIVDKILCSCGAEIQKPATKCVKCNKDLVAPALQTPPVEAVPPKP